MWHTINEINLENYICSLEQAGESLAGCCAVIEPYAPSRLKNTLEKSCCNGNETESYQSFQSGMMCEPLTENHGAVKSMLFAEDSHARTFHALEKERESTANAAECGEKWRELLVKYDRNSHSWKTHLCLWEEDLLESSVILPRWGMMRGGVCWGPQTLAHRTEETESGFLQTPTCTEISLRSEDAWEKKSQKRVATGRYTLPPGTLQEQVMMSGSTPCWDWNKSPKNPAMWPTPTCHNAKEQDSPSEANRNSPSLCHLARGGDKTQPRHLNPEWVEWLMGWPLFWTSLDINVKPYYDSWHEAQQWTQASSEEIQGNIVRNVWWDIDPATTSHGREPDQQSGDKCDDRLPTVPHKDPLFNRELGAGEYQADGLQDLRRDVQAQTRQEVNALWQAGMPEGKRETIGRVAMDVKNRVDRLKAIGNGQVCSVASLAWNTLITETLVE